MYMMMQASSQSQDHVVESSAHGSTTHGSTTAHGSTYSTTHGSSAHDLLYTDDALLEQYLTLDGSSLHNLILAGFRPTEEWKRKWIERRPPLSIEMIESIFKQGGDVVAMRRALDRDGDFSSAAATSKVANAFFRSAGSDDADLERAYKMFKAFGKRLQGSQ